MVPGLELATQLVMEICGGAPSEIVVVGKTYGDDRIIDFPIDEVKRLAGIEVPLVEMRRILGHLGFTVAGSGAIIKVAIPSWRADVQGKADIVEEIVRIVGVDRVPLTPFDAWRCAAQADPDADPGAHPPRQARARRARHGRSRDMVVRRQDRRPNCSAAAARNSRSPTRLRRICRTCAQA